MVRSTSPSSRSSCSTSQSGRCGGLHIRHCMPVHSPGPSYWWWCIQRCTAPLCLLASAFPALPVQVVFRQIDHNHSGTIERDESFEALQRLGFDIPASARSALFNRFAKKRQYMDFDDFVACCCRAELMHSEFFASRQTHMHYTRQDISLLRTLQEFGNEVI